MTRAVLLSAALCAFGATAIASPTGPDARYSPYVSPRHPMNVYWGDTHVHTSWSPDAGGSGNVSLAPEDAYRFARGETITGHSGQPIRLRRPLDFLLISDHSEYLGLFPMLEEGNPALLATETGKRWSEMLRAGERSRIGGEFAASLGANENIVGDRSFLKILKN